ncbi:MAG: SBBP repeat-containing protein, partial [Phaeodactylibacter sp.]|nr:SBBP repeat-containing protein [Phaeodactylibacter sp.]
DSVALEEVTALAADGSDKIYAAGYSSAGGNGKDFVTLKLETSSSVSLDWAVAYDGADHGDDVPKGIAFDGSGNVYVAGYTTTATGKDFLAIKYNPSGIKQWATQLDGAARQDDEARAVAVDENGDVVAAGYVTQNGSRDYYTAILNSSDGSAAWEATFNGLANKDDEASRVEVDGMGNITVLGKNQSEEPEAATYTAVRYVKKSLLLPPDTTAASTSISFFENRGQLIDTAGNLLPEIKFYTDKDFPGAYFRNDRIMFLLSSIDDDSTTLDTLHRVDLTFKNGKNDARVFGLGRKAAFYDFYLGYLPNPRERVGLFERVVITDIYNKVDLNVYSNNAGLKYYFVVKPGGNINDIKMDFEGQAGLSAGEEGELIVSTPLGDFTLAPPIAYQVNAEGERTALEWLPEYAVEGDTLAKFASVGTFDSTRHLVIEIGRPPIHIPDSDDDWVTYLGGDGVDAAFDHVLFNDGFHVVGNTTDIPSFPDAPGNAVALGQADIFVVKVNSSDNIDRASFIGGSGNDFGRAIDAFTDNNGDDIFIVGGHTTSTDFFGAANAPLGGFDGIVFNEFNTKWATYFGSEYRDVVTEVAIHPVSSHLFIVGETLADKAATENSNNPPCQAPLDGSFPDCIASDAYHQFWGGGTPIEDGDAFIAEFNPSGTLQWSTFLGGPDNEATLSQDSRTAIFISPENPDRLAVMGITDNNATFPHVSASGAYGQYAGKGNFVARFGKNQLIWSSGIGCWENYNLHSSIAIDEKGEIYLAGATDCLTPSAPQNYCDVPATGLLPICDPGNIFFQTDTNGDPAPGEQSGISSTYDGYISALTTGNELAWSTYFGGNFYDDIYTVRRAGAYVYLSGTTGSFDKFPLRDPNTGNYQQNQQLGAADAFLGRLKVGTTPVRADDASANPVQINAFPNPVAQAVNIAIPTGSWSLKLFSTDGKLTYQSTVVMHQPGLKLVEMAHLPSGIYVCQLLETSTGQAHFAKIYKY